MSKKKKENILITGSTSGLGFYLASSFLEDNFNVIINGRIKSNFDSAKKILGANGVVGDTTNVKDCKRIIQKTEKENGPIQILICNVGSGKSVKIGRETNKEWKRVLDINLLSSINMVDALVKYSKSKKISVICISSICGHEIIPGAPTTYSVAKSALNFYVKSYADYLYSKNIRINTVSPGNLLFRGSVWEKKMIKEKSMVKKTLSSVTINRLGKVREIYSVIKFLSSENSSFVIGQNLIVDGGQTKSI